MPEVENFAELHLALRQYRALMCTTVCGKFDWLSVVRGETCDYHRAPTMCGETTFIYIDGGLTVHRRPRTSSV